MRSCISGIAHERVAIVTDFDERAVRSRRLNANNLALLFFCRRPGTADPNYGALGQSDPHNPNHSTLQVVVNPPLQRGTPVHDNAFKALHDLGADYVRYVPWLPYPRLGVAELEPPKDGKTSWDFTLMDPMTIDFLEATKQHSTILNFSTIPHGGTQEPRRARIIQEPASGSSCLKGLFWEYTLQYKVHSNRKRWPAMHTPADIKRRASSHGIAALAAMLAATLSLFRWNSPSPPHSPICVPRSPRPYPWNSS